MAKRLVLVASVALLALPLLSSAESSNVLSDSCSTTLTLACLQSEIASLTELLAQLLSAQTGTSASANSQAQQPALTSGEQIQTTPTVNVHQSAGGSVLNQEQNGSNGTASILLQEASSSDSANDTTPSYYVSPYTTGSDVVTAAELQAVGLSPTSGKGALLFGKPTPLVHGISLLDLIAQENIAEYGSPTGPTTTATVTLTESGGTSGTNLTVNPTDSVTVAWSSTGAVSWTSTYTASGCTNSSLITSSQQPWVANSAQGASGAVSMSAWAGCTLNYTYTAYSGPNQTGQSSRASATLTINSTNVSSAPDTLSQIAGVLAAIEAILNQLAGH